MALAPCGVESEDEKSKRRGRRLTSTRSRLKSARAEIEKITAPETRVDHILVKAPEKLFPEKLVVKEVQTLRTCRRSCIRL